MKKKEKRSHFTRVRVLYNIFERVSKYKPMTIKDINDTVDIIYEINKTSKCLVQNPKDKEAQTKLYDLESDLILMGKKYRLIDFSDGQGRNKKNYDIIRIREVLEYHLAKFLSPLMRLLTYIISNLYESKVKDKNKLKQIVNQCGITKDKISENERISFIL